MMKQLPIVLLSLQLFASCGKIVREEEPAADTDGGGEVGNPADAPTIESVAPDRASKLGTTSISVTGTGFSDDSVVILGDLKMTDISVISETELNFTAAASETSEEPLPLRVFTDDGTALFEDAVTYNQSPTVISSSPVVSALGGGGTLTVKGTRFQVNNEGTPVVKIGGVDASDVQVVDDETITATIPSLPLSQLAEPQELTIETSNGNLSLAEAIILLRPGLLFGSNRSQQTPGIFYLDPPTQKVARLIDLEGNVSKLFNNGNQGIGVRFGNQAIAGGAPLGSQFIGVLDITRGTVTPTVTTHDPANTNQTFPLRAIAEVAGEILGFSFSGNFGRVDTDSGDFITIATVAGVDRSACIIPGAPGSIFVIEDMDEPVRIVDTGTGITTTGATLIGDVLPGTDVRCHGVAVFDGSPHIIQFDRNTQKANLSQVNPATGQVNEVSPMPDGSAGLLGTPNFLAPPPG